MGQEAWWEEGSSKGNAVDPENKAAWWDEGSTQVVSTERGSLMKEFNRGVFEDLGLLPTNLINLGLRGVGALSNIPVNESDPNINASLVAEFGITPAIAEQLQGVQAAQIPTQGYTDFWRKIGFTPKEGDETQGVAEWAFRFSGSSFPVLQALSSWGNTILAGEKVAGAVNAGSKVLPATRQLQQMGFGEHLAVSTAQNPRVAIAAESIANVGAAVAGEAARQADAPDYVVVTAELLGGMAPGVGTAALSKLSMQKALVGAAKKISPAFTKAGGERRAAKRLQESVSRGTAREAADKIDPKSSESPARQTEDEGLLELENRILQDQPELKKELEDTIIDLRRQDVAALDGDMEVGRVRKLLISGKNYLLDLLDVRSVKAANELSETIARLGPDTDERAVSRAVRETIDVAYGDGRAQEAQLWNAIDSTAPVDLGGAKATYRRIADARSVWDDPSDIPAYVRKAFGSADEQMAAIKEQLGLAANEAVPEAILNQLPELQGGRFNFNDAKAIRSRMLDDIRAERAAASPNRNKIRILKDIANGKVNEATGEVETQGIIDDISASGVEGADTARDFSRELNNKFTLGRVGRLLGFDVTGAERVTAAATVDHLLGGRDAAVTIEQFIAAAPETKPMVESYLKGKFLAETMNPDGAISTATGNRWVRQWKKKGAFEVYPEMEGEMRAAIAASQKAAAARSRADKAIVASRSPGKSRVAFYLDSDAGTEMKLALNSKRPLAVMQTVTAKVRKDPVAMQELRYSFLEEAIRRSHSRVQHTDGTPIISGRKLTDFWESNEAIVRALQFSPEEGHRVETILTRLRRYDLNPKGMPKSVVNDIQSDILDWMASYVGATAGGNAAKTSGASIVMAGRGASQARKLTYKLLRNHAREFLVRATSDPALYKALLTKGLLVENVMLQGQAPLTPAENTIKAYLIAIGAARAEDFTDEQRDREVPLKE